MIKTNANTKQIHDIKNNIDYLLIFLLGILQILDFFFTWYGVNVINTVVEANILQVWLFEINYLFAFLFRILSISFIVLVLKKLKSLNQNCFLIAVSIGIFLNIYIIFLHFTILL